jgi:dipeptidyl aminopeptidase/acylaminoacyl peptidase
VNQHLLERRLRSLEAPAEGAAGLQAWELVSAEFARREPVPPVRRPRVKGAGALVLAALCLAAIGISPAGADVVRWVGHRIDPAPGIRPARPLLTSLPGPGRVLVSSHAGLWVVGQNGLRRLLGPYRDAAWSPHGLFIAATRGNDLVAMDPAGHVHWSLPRVPRPSDAAWAPDGFRIAYLSGTDLRLVVGDGTDDHLFARHVGGAPPAWRPGAGHVLAYVADGGRVTVAGADLATLIWRSTPGPSPTALAWSPDGATLLAVEPRALRLFDARGRVTKTLALPRGVEAQSASFSPDGRAIALVRLHRASGVSDVRLLSGAGRLWHPRAGAPVTGRFGGVQWSPDGRWLLVGWRDANQWLFVRPSDPGSVVPVSNIARAFASGGGAAAAAFPSVGAWCCSG